jgi:hypothetical protein
VTTPKIEDVAAAAGVHRSTVSRAFSRPEAVKRETRDHVLQVAASIAETGRAEHVVLRPRLLIRSSTGVAR